MTISGLTACSGPQESKDKKVELKTFNDKISYVLGMDIGSSLRQTGTEIDFDVMYKGIEDLTEPFVCCPWDGWIYKRKYIMMRDCKIFNDKFSRSYMVAGVCITEKIAFSD